MFCVIKNKINEFKSNCEGLAAVEMAFIIVGIFAAVPFIYDLSSVANASMTLGGGLRAGAQLAIMQPSNTSGITSTIQTASGFATGSVTVSTSEFCECSGVSATCGIACYGGANPYKYIRVTANYSVPVILPYSGFSSGASTYPLSKSITVRTQ